MLNKKYIEGVLREDNMVSSISKLRTRFSHTMSNFLFFKIFFEMFHTIDIDATITKRRCQYDGGIKTEYYIVINNDKDEYVTRYDSDKLEKDLQDFNNLQGEMGILESTHYLINIFVSLLT